MQLVNMTQTDIILEKIFSSSGLVSMQSFRQLSKKLVWWLKTSSILEACGSSERTNQLQSSLHAGGRPPPSRLRCSSPSRTQDDPKMSGETKPSCFNIQLLGDAVTLQGGCGGAGSSSGATDPVECPPLGCTTILCSELLQEVPSCTPKGGASALLDLEAACSH